MAMLQMTNNIALSKAHPAATECYAYHDYPSNYDRYAHQGVSACVDPALHCDAIVVGYVAVAHRPSQKSKEMQYAIADPDNHTNRDTNGNRGPDASNEERLPIVEIPMKVRWVPGWL